MAYLPLLTEKQTFWTSAGAIASGYKLFIYAAGTTTKSTTYQETTGTANTNPVVLNSRGEVPYGVYVAAGSTYKLVLAPSTDSDPPVAPVWTRDNLSATNDTTVTVDQWQASGFTPTYVSGTSFTVTGDRTSTFQVGRRVKSTNTGGTIYSTIVTSVYGALTTVTVVNDSGTLDAGLSAVSVGLLTPTSPSVPVSLDTYPVVSGSSDRTKKLRFEVDTNVTTGVTRALTVPSADGTIAVTSNADGSVTAPTVLCPISASVAANALTISASSLTLDFRSATLTSGTITRVTGTPANLVISSGSTLGTVSAQQSRIAVLAMNNAGTLELAAVNISGGNDLTETGVISTTAEGGGGLADSASTIYSTTSRSNLAYRVIGYIESTQATAGTWATTPSTIQGAGGNAVTAMSSLGYSQTWQVVTRNSGTTYYNTTGRPILFQSGINNTAGSNITVNGVVAISITASANWTSISAIIPPGASYVLTAASGVSGQGELR